MKLPSNYQIMMGIGVVFLLSAALFIPIRQSRIITRGVDTFSAHRPLFGSHIVEQTIPIQGSLQGAGALIVPYTHEGPITDVTLEALDPATGSVVAKKIIPANQIQDDVFAKTIFDQPVTVSGSSVTLRFSASQATAKNALGVRFDPSTEKLAIVLIEDAPLWRFFTTTIAQNLDRVQLVSIALLCAALVAALSIKNKKRISILVLAMMMLFGIGLRFVLLQDLYGVSGGDAYNYLSITKNISLLKNPFEGEKRLPGFPLLLLPAWLTPLDDLWWMKAVSVVSAGLSLLLLAGIARRLKLPWGVQFLAPVLLLLQKDFLFTSLRPEPYSFYTLLLLSAIWLSLDLERWQSQVSLGLVLGYAAMTRQEGFVLAAVLGFCLLFQWKKLWWRGYLYIGIPAFALVLPFMIHNQLTYGNPIFTPYFEGDRLQIVDSFGAFQDALGATWGIVGSMWKPSWDELTRISFTNPVLISSILLTLVWWIVRVNYKVFSNRWSSLAISMSSMAVVCCSIFMFIASKNLFTDIVMTAAAGVLLASIVPFIFHTRSKGLPLLAILFSQMLIATWFHPFAKHFQQDYPLLILLFTTALLIGFESFPTFAKYFYRLAFIMPLLLITLLLYQNHTAFFDKSNESTASDWVTYRAVGYARNLSGSIGFDQPYQPALLYFGSKVTYYGGDEESSRDEQLTWVHDQAVHTLVVTNINKLFSPPDPGWKILKTFKSAGRDEKIFESIVYQVP